MRNIPDSCELTSILTRDAGPVLPCRAVAPTVPGSTATRDHPGEDPTGSATQHGRPSTPPDNCTSPYQHRVIYLRAVGWHLQSSATPTRAIFPNGCPAIWS